MSINKSCDKWYLYDKYIFKSLKHRNKIPTYINFAYVVSNLRNVIYHMYKNVLAHNMRNG